MKKMFLGLSAVLFAVSSVMEIEAMKPQLRRTKSESSLSDMRSTELHEEPVSQRRNSLPVTKSEIQAAIIRWSHLIPDGEIKSEINRLLPSIRKDATKKELVDLLCSNFDEEYAHYASNVVADIYTDENEDAYKFGRMLAHISSCCTPRHSSFYWECYADEYYNTAE